MRFDALACDYDGTLATEGRIAPETRSALGRLRAARLRVVLVTGRRFDDLRAVCPGLDDFDQVVAENGGVLFAPTRGLVEDVAPPPPPAFLRALERARVPFSVGRVIVATERPHDVAVSRVIRDLGLDLAIIFNNESVMVLPRGVTKGSGLAAALAHLGVTPERTVAIGDAENDIDLLAASGFGVAVGNAVAPLVARAHLVTGAPNGAGVRELVSRLLRDDL